MLSSDYENETVHKNTKYKYAKIVRNH